MFMVFPWSRVEVHLCRLAPERGGHLVLAWRTDEGWRVWCPRLDIDVTVRNPRLHTWLTAGPVIDRVLRAHLEGSEPDRTT